MTVDLVRRLRRYFHASPHTPQYRFDLRHAGRVVTGVLQADCGVRTSRSVPLAMPGH